MYKKVGLASLIMMASVFLSRLTGLIREQVIAYIGGIGGGVDAYQGLSRFFLTIWYEIKKRKAGGSFHSFSPALAAYFCC